MNGNGSEKKVIGEIQESNGNVSTKPKNLMRKTPEQVVAELEVKLKAVKARLRQARSAVRQKQKREKDELARRREQKILGLVEGMSLDEIVRLLNR